MKQINEVIKTMKELYATRKDDYVIFVDNIDVQWGEIDKSILTNLNEKIVYYSAVIIGDKRYIVYLELEDNQKLLIATRGEEVWQEDKNRYLVTLYGESSMWDGLRDDVKDLIEKNLKETLKENKKIN